MCAEGRERTGSGVSGRGRSEMKCKCLNELLRDYREHILVSRSRIYLPLINACVIIRYGWSLSSFARMSILTASKYRYNV